MALRRLLVLATTAAVVLGLTPAAHAGEPPLKAVATASSEPSARHTATKTTDGNPRTSWRAGREQNQWLTLDLGAISTINRFVLSWGRECGRVFEVQTSPDGIYWNEIHRTSIGNGGTIDRDDLTANGRFIRVYLERPCYDSYEIPEFQVYGKPGVVDVTPPNPPAGLRATASTATSVRLEWTPAADNVQVVAYDIYNSGAFVKTVDGGATNNNNVTRLNPNTPYSFYVNARDAAGNVSQASNTVNITTPPAVVDNEPPSVPTNVRAVPTANGVALTWTASTDNVGVASYAVFREGAQAGTSATPNATISGLAANTAYAFTVKAIDTSGKSSAFTEPVAVTTTRGRDAVGQMTRVVADTDVPWGLEFLPDGSALYAQRDSADVVRVTRTGEKTVVGHVPNVVSTDGEGGLLGVERRGEWIYLYHTSPTDNRLVRMRLADGKLTDHQVLLTGAPRNKFHNGGRLRFGPDGKLYIATGDGQVPQFAQDLNSLGGKVLRVNPDGSVPRDNPFPGKYVYSYGHRNVQGLAFDSRGRLWEAEFGNSIMDEVNLIKPGGNYGWPACEGTAGACDEPTFVKPQWTSPVSAASPSGLTIVNDVLYLAALRGQKLYRMPITRQGLGAPTSYFEGHYGRLRTVERSPDGGLWLTTSNGDKDSIPHNSTTVLMHVALR
ncbi:PQQ-dependent sugar dehydrogenase [Lentzea tibetensis]|uniref:PQQ-dependent sugar dehydrogenase n=1 Tax=Lentzea tibetensis TaxID=2591470 RepID=UPI0016468B8A|nr:PQQ-dependent sugar dehydrogenase [Lentzea tibetensis]